ELCGKILGLQLHHEPSAGGAVESRRFERQYEQTIESYQAAFGEAPPADIWPVRTPAESNARGKKVVVAGAAAMGTAIALRVGSLPLFIFVAIAGLFAYSHVANARLNSDKRASGCGAAGSGGHAAAGGSCGAGSCGGAGGSCGGGGGGC